MGGVAVDEIVDGPAGRQAVTSNVASQIQPVHRRGMADARLSCRSGARSPRESVCINAGAGI